MKNVLYHNVFLANAGIQEKEDSTKWSFIERFKRLYRQLDPRIREEDVVGCGILS